MPRCKTCNGNSWIDGEACPDCDGRGYTRGTGEHDPGSTVDANEGYYPDDCGSKD